MAESDIKNRQESRFSRPEGALEGAAQERAEMKVEVAYAKPEVQVILAVKVEPGTTVEECIRRSGILARFPEIELAEAKVGIFSKACGLDHVPRPNDRIEIYRPLIADPKEARRHRAAKKGEAAEG